MSTNNFDVPAGLHATVFHLQALCCENPAGTQKKPPQNWNGSFYKLV